MAHRLLEQEKLMTIDTQTFLTDAKTTATGFVDEAKDLIDRAEGIANTFTTFTPKEFVLPQIPSFDIPEDAKQVPKFTAVLAGRTFDVQAPELASIPIPDTTSDFDKLADIPTLDTSSLFNDSKPSLAFPPLSATLPNITTDFTMPDAPSIEIGEAPEITALDVRATPRPTVPTFADDFTGVDPVSDDPSEAYSARRDTAFNNLKAAADDVVSAWITKYVPEYQAAMQKLEDRIREGMDGTILPDGIEQRIFDRARARAQAEGAAKAAQITSEAAKRGFVLPASLMMDGIARAQKEASDRIAAASSETAIQRTQIEIQHLQFCMQTSASLRQSVWDAALGYAQLTVSMMETAIRDANAFAEIMIRWYNAQLDLFRAKMDLYRTEAQVYETKLTAAFADLEAFKSELEAERVKKDVERLQIDAYQTKIASAENKVRLYVSQLQGVQTQAQIERIKVDTYAQEIQAYVALVRAKGAEFEAYQASLSGDEAKVRAYQAEVNAWSAQVEAIRNKIRAQADGAQITTESNRTLLDLFQAKLDEFKVGRDADIAQFRGDVDAYKALLSQFTARLDAESRSIGVNLESEKLNLNSQLESYKVNQDVGIENLKIGVQQMQVRGQIYNSAANISAHVAGSALDSLNAIVHEAKIEESTA